jgi:hypothetical protein
MPKRTIPAAGGAMPAATSINGGEFPHLSTLIADPFVRRAFERAEREDGTAPAVVAADPHKPMQGGAEARREAADA